MYKITLLVTWEQENAIVRLFKEMCWQYNKTDQQGTLGDRNPLYDQMNLPASNILPETHGLNSQSNETATDPVISCISEVSETDESSQAYHCHEIIKTETNIVDTSTAYCKLCNEDTEKASTSTKDFTAEVSEEMNESENVDPTLLLNSKLSQTELSLAPVDDDTDVTFKVTKRRSHRLPRKQSSPQKTSPNRTTSSTRKPSSTRKTTSTRKTSSKKRRNKIISKLLHDHKCKDCGQIFPQKINLKRHRKSCHSEDLIFKCDKCAFKLPSETELYIHTLKKHGQGDGKFPCPKCPKVYTLAKTLRNHMHHIHLGLGIPCSHCGKVCSKYDIKHHEAIHRLTKDYKCDLCSAAFKTKAELTIHRRRHTKPYSVYCEVCGQGCFSGKELVEHRRIHTGEKPFACSLCDYRCAHKPNLKIHMKVHNKQTAPPNTGAPTNTGMTAPTNTGVPPNTGVTAPPNTGVSQIAGITAPPNTGIPLTKGMTAPLNTGMTAPPNTGMGSPLNTGMTGFLNTGVTTPLNAGVAGPLNTGVTGNLTAGVNLPPNTGVPMNLTYNAHERQQQVGVPRNTGVNTNITQNTHERQQQANSISEYRFPYRPYLFYQ